jgi:arylsulfatase A-like enzyme
MARLGWFIAWGAWCGCAGTDVDAVDTDAPVQDTAPPAPPSARVEPARAWVTSGPLTCVAEGRVTWLLNGAAVPDLTGDTVPADRLAPGQDWTCVAARGGQVAVDTRHIDPPNVLLVLTDDLGNGDVGFMGGTIPTPRLDGLAAQGVVLGRAYAAAPVCGPSRAGLMTGRQPARFGFEYNVGDGGDDTNGIPPEEALIPELLRDAGLTTGLFGKWHLGVSEVHHPGVNGFDTFFGFLDGKRPALDPSAPGVRQAFVDPREVAQWPMSLSGQPLQRDGVEVTIDDRHLTDRTVDEALVWIGDHADVPWLAMVSLQSPHIPLLATEAWLAAVPEQEDEAAWLYDANVHGLDAAIGRLVDGLGPLDPHTLVVFTSDNGCPEGPVACSNGGLRGGKLTLQEGGLRVPTFVRWPGALAGGRTVDAATSHLDLLPTLAAATGARLPRAPIDGVDLGPALRGEVTGDVHDRLYWRMLPARGILDGDLKVVQIWDRTWQFDLRVDPTEQVDLHPTEPERSEAMVTGLEERSGALRAATWLGTWAPGVYYGEETVLMY